MVEKLLLKSRLLMRLIGVVLFFGSLNGLFASWNLSFDGDARGVWSVRNSYEAELHALGFSVRKSFADKSGDRFILSGLLEAKHNFKDLMVHELYLRYKGPMGKWNITAGRIGIPYGLLTSFSTSRLLFESPVEELLGFDADNGISVSGIRGAFDYGFSLTQGYGAHRMPGFPGEGFGAGRIGMVFGEAEEYGVGISLAGGTTSTHHMVDTSVSRFLGGMDLTMNIRQLIIRGEIDAGFIQKKKLLSAFSLIDYALHNRLDLNCGIRYMYHNHGHSTAVYSGITFKPPWFTVRGGYTYEKSQITDHRFAVQLYRLFSYSF